MKKRGLNYQIALSCVMVFILGACNSIFSKSDPTVQPLIRNTPSMPSEPILAPTFELETQVANTLFLSKTFHVSLSFPETWKKASGYDERYQGEDGFVSLGAKVTETYSSIKSVCEDEINHVLQPYGSAPSVQYMTIDDQEACLIFPSDDQNDAMENAAEIVVRYPQAITINGSSYSFAFLQVLVSQGYALSVIPTLKFETIWQ
jgi:hypothetical protein